jgi:hypothetical protein
MDALGSRGERVAGGLVNNAISQQEKRVRMFIKGCLTKHGISAGEGFGNDNDLNSGYNWWRCRDLAGLCFYDTDLFLI